MAVVVVTMSLPWVLQTLEEMFSNLIRHGGRSWGLLARREMVLIPKAWDYMPYVGCLGF